jgi:hypothetical protein
MAQEKLTWTNLDTASFKGGLAKAYQDVKKAQEAAKEAREAFEEQLRAVMNAEKLIPTGHDALFSYRFGNLSVAFDTIKAPKGKPAMIQIGGKAPRK